MRVTYCVGALLATVSALTTGGYADVVLYSTAHLTARANAPGDDDTQTLNTSTLPYGNSHTADAGAGAATTFSTYSLSQSGFNTTTQQSLSPTGNLADGLQIIWFNVSTETAYSVSGAYDTSGEPGTAHLRVILFPASGLPVFENVQTSFSSGSATFVVGGQAGTSGNLLTGSPTGILAPGNYSFQTIMETVGHNRVGSGHLALTLGSSPAPVPLPAAVWGGLALFGGLGLNKQFRRRRAARS